MQLVRHELEISNLKLHPDTWIVERKHELTMMEKVSFKRMNSF